LATVLVHSGVDVTPDALVQEVYLPDRRGSLQIEMMASARRHGRLPVPLSQNLPALLEEVASGSPVLVLQNLGFSRLPRWHYAVVVGYDPAARTVLLRSGRQARRQEGIERFDPGTYLRAVMESRHALRESDVGLALAAGAAHWPGSANLAFAAANHALESGDTHAAVVLYEQALSADADHLGALNNLADLMLSLGEVARARALIDRALSLVQEGSPFRAVIEATQEEIAVQEER
jgi:tetratricopeptide (TPR) repeat protein